MLEKALGRKLNNTMLDSLELFCLFKPHFTGHNLQYLLQHYLEEERPEEHRALADARDTMELLKKLFTDLAGKDYDLLEGMLRRMRGTGWVWLPYLQRIAPSTLKQLTSLAPAEEKDEPGSIYTFGDIEYLLKNKKAWREYSPGYNFREQQLQMALSVADSFQGKQAIFIEAPTGSGKTLAYLLAALIFITNEKEQVFISTNTKNLQQQVLEELPRIAAVLGAENLRFTDMKGLSNYACRRRVEEEMENPGGNLETKLAGSYLFNWVRRTASGVLDETSYWYRLNNPQLNTLISQIECRREDCDGNECRFKSECFYRRKVRMMRNAHLCLINHSLLLTWPESYPKIKRLIIDEAHALEEKSYDSFTRGVSSLEMTQLLGRLVRKEKKGYLYYLQFYGRKVCPTLEIKPALQEINKIRQYSRDLQLILEPLQHKKYSRRMEIKKDFSELEAAALSLSIGLATLARSLDEILTEIGTRDEDFEETTLFRQGGEYLKTCRAWSVLLEDCFKEELKNSCSFLEFSRHKWHFCIAPLDVADLFYSKVLSGCSTLLLTSATLAEENGYERHLRALGFERMEQERVIFADPLPDVYNYRENSVLGIPSDSPGYNNGNFTDYMAKAVVGAAKMLGGRTMALFTSLERMQAVIEKTRISLEKEGISVFGGGDRSGRGDLSSFRKDEKAVLFGSRGFFEGVDISGPALSCIIIDKLSFPFQNDPLFNARAKYLEKAGLNPFNGLFLADAKRTLRQQFGRLIRTETDKGFVLVLDQLGGGKRYRRSVLEELPNTQIMQDMKLDEILEIMREKYVEWGYELS
jgi:ATP-dependent DNA helicase DinG